MMRPGRAVEIDGFQARDWHAKRNPRPAEQEAWGEGGKESIQDSTPVPGMPCLTDGATRSSAHAGRVHCPASCPLERRALFGRVCTTGAHNEQKGRPVVADGDRQAAISSAELDGRPDAVLGAIAAAGQSAGVSHLLDFSLISRSLAAGGADWLARPAIYRSANATAAVGFDSAVFQGWCP